MYFVTKSLWTICQKNIEASCFIKTFRDSKMINLIKEPILDNENLKKVPKVLVLQHCRGDEHIDENTGSSSDSECETDGATYEYSHRMVSIFICGLWQKLSQPF